MEAEATMICMDTSMWMQSVASCRFKKQADAIKLYCAKKLNSHPHNVVGVCGMGERFLFCVIKPTRDLRKIMNAIYYHVRIGGYLLLSEAISYAHCSLLSSPESHMQKRIVVFAGGVVFQPKLEGEALGKMMKERNLACDVVNFGHKSANKKELFDTLIAAADNNGNCHILHVEPPCSVRHALSRSPVIPQVEEGESTTVAVASLPMEDEREKHKRKSQPVSQKIQQAKLNTPTQEIVKLNLKYEKKKEQIDALTRENEILKRELELSRKEKNQLLSAIAKLYELASKGTSEKTIPQIQWSFLPKPALTNIPGYYADAVKTFQTEIASIFVNEIAKNV